VIRPLPQPERERWQPLRAGLVDVFYYDQEEFHFRDGRLLLRGNNGTGKSKVLALTLPFLLDGELSPHRVEPDADPKKRMDWNLLLGGEHPNAERLGYTWLELGRRDADGNTLFCTLGCGLKAVSGRGIASHWFFLSDQRVGEELALVDGAHIALTRERLEEALGARGVVHRTAGAYRRAVDEALFGLGEQRYGALIDLLIKIRAPQLSKRPNERALSDALTGALAPLDQALIADVAEAFRGLEEDRADLTAMVDARDAADGYLDTYRHYARIACRRRAALPRQAQTVFDRVSRDLADAEAAHQRAQAELQEVEVALAELQSEDERLRARERALRESPEARSARELERAADDARRAVERSVQAQAVHDRGVNRLEQQRQRLADAAARTARAQEELTQARAMTVEQAGVAGIADSFVERVDHPIEIANMTSTTDLREADGRLEVVDATETVGRSEATDPVMRGASEQRTDLTELRARAGEIVERQERGIDHLRALFVAAADSRRALIAVRERHEELASEAAAVAEQREQAAELLAEAGRDLTRAARVYFETASVLSFADAPEVLAGLELWVETLDGPSPLTAALATAGRAASAALAREESALDAEEHEVRELLDELDASIERLQAGEHELPPVPHTRDPSVRDGRAGAPLWLLVDFRSDVPEERRAGIEAGLEASGILDAWVSPGGELLAPGTQDVLLTPPEGKAVSGARLHDVLEPAIDHDDSEAGAVGEESVRRVLAAVALAQGDGTVWVTPEGEFRNGILRGSWRKPAAAFIGRGARDLARRARLAELNELREQAQRQGEELADARRRVEARHTEMEEELLRVPVEEAVRGAHGALAGREAEQARLAERIAATTARLTQAEAASAQAELAVREGADQLGLPQEEAELDAMREGLQAFRVELAALWPACVAFDQARDTALEAGRDVASATRELTEHFERLQAATREQAERKERHETLAQTVGAAVAELQQRLADVASALRVNERGRRESDARRAQAQRDEGIQVGRRQRLAEELEQATEQRRADVERLRRFASTGLIAVALGEVELPEGEQEWGVTAALRLARQIEQALADAPEDEPAWQRAQRRAADELNTLADALRRHGNNASASMLEEGITVEVVFRGRSTTVPELASALAEEVADRRRLLDEREREILENHLVNEVASTLQELISDAEHQVAGTNAELARRPTSTGMQLRLRWRVLQDGPQGLPQARERLLRQSADAWSEDDRAAVGAFLQAQIQEVRSRDVTGTWIEQLTEALDYRAWHRFEIERQQGGRWRTATGPASGGERVLTASVPLFAAASSYYASAGNDHAPRLVMLDEAFAGVDDDARAKCLGLLTAFDLDVVMTSEREWGCYREVPGLAIAQLSRVDDVAAVLVSHWEWDGATRTRVERPVAAVAADPTEGSLLGVDGVGQSSDGSLLDGYAVEKANDGQSPGGEGRWGTPSASG
jgi:uncharacterized protein (TIGR02680 family)